MSKEICVSSTPHETRLAILEDEQLTEVYYERENEYTLAGSIYKGRVTRVLPGMQSAFVDLGLERDAFLYVTDFMEEQEDSSEFERIPTQWPQRAEPRVSAPAPGRAADPACRGATRAAAQRGPVSPSSEGRPAVRRRQGSLRMGPGVGGAVVAAARAFAHRKGASRRASNRQLQVRAEVPPPVQPAATIEPEPQDRRPAVAFSLPGESLSKYGAERPQAADARRPMDRCTAAARQCCLDQAFHVDRDATPMERRRAASRGVHLPLSR